MRIPYFKPLNPIRRLAIELLLWWQALFLAFRPAVLVLQMGKVGSVSLAEAVRRTGKFRVFQFHLLNKDEIQESIATSDNRRRYPPKHLYVSNFVLNHELPRSDRPKIITVVRDPVARNLSAYFENIDEYFLRDICNRFDVSALIKKFFSAELHGVPIEFFDKEIKEKIGINVYSFDFPWENGHQVIPADQAEILIMQFEINEETKREAIQDFLQIPTITIPELNVSVDKYYGSLYKEILEMISIPTEYLDRMYGSEYMTHFYSPKQIQAFRKRWMKK